MRPGRPEATPAARQGLAGWLQRSGTGVGSRGARSECNFGGSFAALRRGVRAVQCSGALFVAAGSGAAVALRTVAGRDRTGGATAGGVADGGFRQPGLFAPCRGRHVSPAQRRRGRGLAVSAGRLGASGADDRVAASRVARCGLPTGGAFALRVVWPVSVEAVARSAVGGTNLGLMRTPQPRARRAWSRSRSRGHSSARML